MTVNIEKQWEVFMDTIKTHITGKRQKQLIDFYEKIADRVLTAPASSHTSRHNCFPGGYIDHVNRVVKVALSLYDTWTVLGANVKNYTKEELVFAAINHDLGKVGSMTDDYYVPNDSKWHIERGQVYKINPKLQFMKVPDRSVFLLHENGIAVSENEYLAIKLHDGLYSKGNESYLMAGQPEFALKTDLPILLHHSDHLATLIEAAIAHQPEVVHVAPTPNKIKSKLTGVNDPVVDQSLKDAFDEIFNS
jgi:hypothetical protein